MIARAIPASEIPAIRATGYDPAALLTAVEVAKLLRVSESWLRKQRYQGYGPRPIVVGPRCIRYRAIDLQVWLAERARAHRQSTSAA